MAEAKPVLRNCGKIKGNQQRLVKLPKHSDKGGPELLSPLGLKSKGKCGY